MAILDQALLELFRNFDLRFSSFYDTYIFNFRNFTKTRLCGENKVKIWLLGFTKSSKFRLRRKE